MFSFKACFRSEHFWLSLNLSCHALFQCFFCRNRYQTKQTLTLTLLFQRNFLVVVGADNMTIFFIFIGFIRNGAGSVLKFS